MTPILCPYCAHYGPPAFGSETSPLGWVVAVLLLLTTCIGAPLGLLMTRTFPKCARCHMRLGAS